MIYRSHAHPRRGSREARQIKSLVFLFLQSRRKVLVFLKVGTWVGYIL